RLRRMCTEKQKKLNHRDTETQRRPRQREENGESSRAAPPAGTRHAPALVLRLSEPSCSLLCLFLLCVSVSLWFKFFCFFCFFCVSVVPSLLFSVPGASGSASDLSRPARRVEKGDTVGF